MTFVVYPVLIMWSRRSCFNNLDKTTPIGSNNIPHPRMLISILPSPSELGFYYKFFNRKTLTLKPNVFYFLLIDIFVVVFKVKPSLIPKPWTMKLSLK